MTQAEKDSVVWFKTQLKKVSSAEAAETYDKGNRRFIGPGAMILFKYPNPKTSLKKLKFFDANPNPIIIDVRRGYILGLNLHWVPTKFREVVLKFIIKQNKSKIKQNKRFELDFLPLREFLKRNGLYNVCIKKYLTNRIAGLQYIKYSDWKHIVNLPLEKFVTDSQYSRADIDKIIMGHALKTKTSKNTRYGR